MGAPAPRFQLSIELRDTPDLICRLKVSNPGSGFTLRSARLVAPRDALIYRREYSPGMRPEARGFTEIQLDREIRPGETLEIPFEVWMPHQSRVQSLEVAVQTDRRRRRYRCDPITPGRPLP